MLTEYEEVELLALLEAEQKEGIENSLAEYIKEAWHVIEPATAYIHNWHIDCIAEHLEAVNLGQIKRLLVNLPPRNMKSIAVTVKYPTWTWIRQPHKRFISLSYSDILSRNHNINRRDIIESQWYQKNWGDKFELKDDVNRQNKFANNYMGFMYSTSIGGTITGEGGDVIIVDDPHNPKQAESDAERKTAVEFFRQTLPSRLNDKKTGAIIVVMQRLHEDDVSGYILKNDLGYTHLCLPAEAEKRTIVTFPITMKQIVREEGDILNPHREGKPELDQLKRDMGSYAFAGQYQQNPAPSGGGLLKKWWWGFWQYPGQNLPPVSVKEVVKTAEGDKVIDKLIYPETIQAFDEEYQSWDMSFKAQADNDLVACGIWGKIKAKHYLIDLIEKRLEFIDTLKEVRVVSEKYPNTSRKLVEDKANGPAVINTLKSEITGLIAINPGQDNKVARAQAITHIIESGNVYLPHPQIASWVEEFIDRCSKFPRVAHDDIIDQMTQYLNYTCNRTSSGWLEFLAQEAENVDKK